MLYVKILLTSLRFKSIKNPDQKIMSPYQDPLKDISIYHRNIS